MSILEVKGIKKRFDSLEVLKGIDFSLEKGETLSIIGTSGSGKTTLLRCINFLGLPDEGQILVNGETIYDASQKALTESEIRQRRMHFGMVFQQFNLFPQYTALGNVTLARELQEKKKPGYKGREKEIREQLRQEGLSVLDSVGLLDKADYYPHQLSGGQQQRVAIARALMMKPDILCFDEPTSALDPELTGEVLKVIRQLAEQNTTMIIVTHEMAFARDVANHVIFMDGGRICEQGDPQQVFNNPREERTRQFLSRFNEQN